MKHTFYKGFAVLLLAASMIACGSAAGDEKEPQTGSGNADTETAVVTEDPYKLPEADFSGAEINFLVTEEGWGYWHVNETESTGDVLPDAVYQRNRAVEDALGVTITESFEHYSTVYETASNSILAGEDTYDAMTLFAYKIMTGAMDGMMLDVSAYSVLDFTQPWWNKAAIDDMAMGDKRFMMIGDIHLMFYESYYAMMFNQDLISKYDLEDPYALVAEGKWTYDQLYALSRAVAQDLNGDSKMTPTDDQYGVCMHQNSGQSMILAMGGMLTERDADGIPVYTGAAEPFVNAFNKVAALYNDKELVMTNATPGAQNVISDIGSYNQVFVDGRSLFLTEVVGTLSELRSMDSNFGIVVMPKSSEADAYISPVYHNAIGLCIPVTNTEAEMTATVLEALAIKSHQLVRPVYYETVLGSKLTRDEASVQSLDTVFKSGRFEPAYVYGWGDITDTVYRAITSGSDVVSKLEKVEKKINTQYNNTIEAFVE